MIRNWWKQYGPLIGVLGMVLVCLVTLLPRGSKPSPARSLGLNTEFAFPGKETPLGSEVDSGALVENANAWNGLIVTLTGEAIGERMIRGDMAWIHVNDDAYAKKNVEEAGALEGYNSGHAIWLSADLARQIQYFGDYQHAGDIVKVVGVFDAASREHGGDMVIHATSLTIVHPGHPVPHVTHTGRALLAAVMMSLAGVLYGLRLSAARRRI